MVWKTKEVLWVLWLWQDYFSIFFQAVDFFGVNTIIITTFKVEPVKLVFFFLSWNFLGRKTRQAKNWCVDKSIRSLMAEKEWLEIQLTCDIGGAIMVARDDGAFPTKWGAIWDPLESSKSQGSQHLLVCWNVLFVFFGRMRWVHWFLLERGGHLGCPKFQLLQ